MNAFRADSANVFISSLEHLAFFTWVVVQVVDNNNRRLKLNGQRHAACACCTKEAHAIGVVFYCRQLGGKLLTKMAYLNVCISDL